MSQQNNTRSEESKPKRRGFFTRSLDFIEWTGNKLPDPIIIFALLCLFILVLSAIAGLAGWRATHPDPEIGEVVAVNLLSVEGMRQVIGNAASSFGAFPALGVVLIIMLGIGVAERSGWFEVMLQSSMKSAPKMLIIPSIAFIGLLGNVAGDAAPIVLPPLAAMIFIKLGWHPVAGIALAYAASIGGFAANIMLGMSDALVQGFTQPAVESVGSSLQTNVAMNWYFIAASVLVLLPVLWIVTAKITIPRLGKFEDPAYAGEEIVITDQQRKANRWAIVALLAFVGLIVALCIPQNSFMRNAETGSLTTEAPLMNGISLILAFFFFIPGLVYGIVAGTIKKSSDVTKMMTDSMASMASFIVIVFFASQMLAYVTASKLGAITAVKGAEILEGHNPYVIIIGLIALSAFLNLFIGSASAKWGILAPIFVPMMMLLDFHPAFTQMMYRIGDSITNPITPMFPYFALVLSYAVKYDKKIKIGTFISTLIPYSFFMGIMWIGLAFFWFTMGWPVGVDGPIYLGG